MSRPADRYAVCERVLRQGSFADDVALVRVAGIGAMEWDVDVVDQIGVPEAVGILDGEGVRASSYMGLGEIFVADGITAPMDDVARHLDVAARLGAPSARRCHRPARCAGSGAGRHDLSRLARRRSRVVRTRRADRLLEPVHPLMRRWSYVHTLRHGLTLVAYISGAGLVLDLGHVWWEHGLDGLIREHIDEIVSVQLTNVDTGALDELRYERSSFDCGDVPVASLVRLLETAGYRGWYENEILARIPRDRRLDVLRASRVWVEAL